MKHTRIFVLWISLLALVSWSCRDTATTTTKAMDQAQVRHQHTHVTQAMVAAATDFLASLDEEQKKIATFGATEDEKYDWHFVPQDDRKGLVWRDMSEAQRTKAQALMKSVLSNQGYLKAEAIRSLELVLREVEDRPDDDWYRNPEKYYFSVFGMPSMDADWGWRMEGHHLSLNFSSGKEQLVAVTPAFMGTNPAIVRSGSKEGMEVLKQEQDQGRALVKSLSEEQFGKALMDPTAPKDIISFVDRVVNIKEFIGLPASEMSEDQQTALRKLLSVYTNNMEAEIAESQWKRIEEKGFDKLPLCLGGRDRSRRRALLSYPWSDHPG